MSLLARGLTGALVACAVVLSAACSSSKSGSSAPPAGSSAAPASSPPVSLPASSASVASSTAASSSAAAVGTGACKYLSVAEASKLAASPVRPGVTRSVTSGPVRFDYCDYIFDPGNAPGVSIAVAHLSGDPKALFQQFRAEKQAGDRNFQDVPGVGDAAFYANENLNVLKGNMGLIVFVGRANGVPRGTAGLPDEKAAAALILPRF